MRRWPGVTQASLRQRIVQTLAVSACIVAIIVAFVCAIVLFYLVVSEWPVTSFIIFAGAILLWLGYLISGDIRDNHIEDAPKVLRRFFK